MLPLFETTRGSRETPWPEEASLSHGLWRSLKLMPIVGDLCGAPSVKSASEVCGLYLGGLS